MSDSTQFLARVREALREPAPLRHLHGHGVVKEEREEGPESFRNWMPPVGTTWSERFELFQANAAVLKAEVILYSGADDLAAKLDQRAREENWRKIALHRGAWSTSLTNGLPTEKMFRETGYDVRGVESCDVGITECDALIAQTGSVLVTSTSAGGRLLSVLPPHHIVLARHDQLIPDLEAAFAYLHGRYSSAWPSFISFITGPSRTGDIERILVLGAHGPKRLTVYCDRPAA